MPTIDEICAEVAPHRAALAHDSILNKKVLIIVSEKETAYICVTFTEDNEIADLDDYRASTLGALLTAIQSLVE